MLNIKIFGLAFVLSTLLVLNQSQYIDVLGQQNIKQFDMILLNQQYYNNPFVDQLVGEILNNGTHTAKSVEISALFYNDSGIVGHESSGTDPTTISAGDKSTFTLQIDDEVIRSEAEGYEFTLKWKDEQSTDYFLRISGGEIAESVGRDDGDDSSGGGGGDDGDDSSGGGGGDDGDEE
ncbi:hypothetical protein [Candidatus Nitrosocosmicus franklandus]|nr:hypothetical protein [Candidatus Nitrosocosmicus franklandus]